jgi:uncharacterized protein
MFELPLFPLNTVLFPGMPLSLHIFEDRYKQMVNECIDESKPFGVVLIQSGDEALGPVAEPHRVGTTALITQVQRLPFGRLNILAIGRDRFQIHSLNHDKPYLAGLVDYMPFQSGEENGIKLPEDRVLRKLMTRYLAGLNNAGFQLAEAEIPSEPLSLAYLAAVLLRTEAREKQQLLETPTTLEFVNKLISMYKLELALLEVMLAPPNNTEDSQSPFSAN